MPRPSKLDDSVRERVAALIRAGNTVEIAAQAAGISEATFHAWMARGEGASQSDRPYRVFREAVEQARAEAEAAQVARIAKAASNGSWQAAAWLLERRHPERWAKPNDRRLLAQDADRQQQPEDDFEALDELAPRRRDRSHVA